MIHTHSEAHAFTLTLADLKEDAAELGYLLRDSRKKLSQFQKDLSHIRRNTPDQTAELVDLMIAQASDALKNQDDIVSEFTISLRRMDLSDLHRLTALKYVAYERQRVITRMTGALISSIDWQSPAYAESFVTQSGRDSGRILSTVNDYKRDQHYMGITYETAYKREYIRSIFKLPVTVLATHSGMAAFTTILNYLLIERGVAGPVIAGRSVYFEALDMLKKLFGDKLIIWDETDTRELIQILKHTKPQAIFIDTLGNTPSMIMPDMRTISGILKKHLHETVYLILDNTCMATSYNPLSHFGHPGSHVRLIVYESLNKLHQYGIDGTFGGIIWATGRDGVHLFDFREHLGTIIGDTQVSALPAPNRKIFDIRLKRLNRNAFFIAGLLANRITQSKDTIVSSLVFPMLPGHPSHTYAGRLGYGGPFFMIDLKEKYCKPATLKKIASEAVRLARKEHVRFAAGTSFGLPVTRIYPTATRSKTTRPFLRIAVGTESYLELDRIARIIAGSLKL